MSLRFLALGDSYTIGEGVDAPDSWPMHLAQLARHAGIALDDPRMIATTGWSTDELAAAISAASPDKRHDLVTLLIGVNDQYRGRNAENYAIEFADLLGRAIEHAGGDPAHVLVVSIPDWGVTPYAAESGRDPRRIAVEIDELNATACEHARRRGARWLDITPISRGIARVMLVADRLHPCARQYSLWAQAALPIVRTMLTQSPSGHERPARPDRD